MFKLVFLVIMEVEYKFTKKVTHNFLYFFNLWLKLIGAPRAGDAVLSCTVIVAPNTSPNRTQSSVVLKSECAKSKAKTFKINQYLIKPLIVAKHYITKFKT